MTPHIIPATAAAGSLAISSPDFENMIATRYDEAAQESLRFWFFAAKERNLSLSQLAQMTGLSSTVLSKLFRGVYDADPASALEQLRRARNTFHESAASPEFIETALSRRMFRIFDKTRALRNVSILWGPMGIGKTECVMEYQRRNNHGRTQVVRFPAGASFAYFVAHVARAVGVATRSQSQFHQREKIMQVLAAGQRLLIIDELHQAFLTTRTDTAVRACEFLREISDVANCGLVLIGTELLEEQVFRGPHKEALRQLVDRGTVQVPLPAKASNKDHENFLQFYGLNLPDAGREPKAAAILADIIRHAGLRKLTLHLRDGAAFAARKNEPYAWSHFVAAFEAIQSLSK
jgi:DNA transposition AAA+ family ATPase